VIYKHYLFVYSCEMARKKYKGLAFWGLDIGIKEGIVPNARQSKLLNITKKLQDEYTGSTDVFATSKQKSAIYFFRSLLPSLSNRCGLFVCIPFLGFQPVTFDDL
jgi:hypothetical protein